MIKQIWFDFGNVFIPIFPERTKEAFEDRGVQFTEEGIQRLNHEFEVGEITSAQFFQEIASSCKYLQSSSAIAHAWNMLLGEMTDPTLFLKKLGKSYDLCLVSNTNEAHIKHIRKQAGPFLWNSFVEKFEALFLSYEIGHRKPDASYFNYVLEHMDAKPEEVLFVDDSSANIEAAEALGINTFLFNLQEQDLAKELPAVLAKFDQRTARAFGV